MLNGRLYRAAFVPFLLALAVGAFSLGSRPQPFTSTLAPDAFEGASAFAELQSMLARFPSRRPGSSGDEQLAGYVAGKLEALGGTAGGGFSVHRYTLSGQTIDGERRLSTIVAERPGSTGASPIVIVAHRDAAAAGSTAELSSTAALLELARALSTRATKRAIVIVSTSGGSGGDAAAAELASDPSALGLRAPFDAAIVIGDVAGRLTRTPVLVPFSDGFGAAPLVLQRTLAQAVDEQAGVQAGAPSLLGQLAHLAFPLAPGEQGVLDAGGVPAVLVQASGERGPPSGGRPDPPSAERLEGFGHALLSAVDALDGAPDVPRAMASGLQLQQKTVPLWVLRLLVGTLLLPPLVAVLDAFARARRRRLPVRRATLWTLSCALPFFTCAVFVYLLSLLGVLAATPSAPVLPGAMPLDARALGVLAATGLTFALAWMLRSTLMRRAHQDHRPDPALGSLALTGLALVVALIAWLGNPLTALLALPALHAWLWLGAGEHASFEQRPPRALTLTLVAVGLVPLALLLAFYADQLALGPGQLAWMGVLALAGGHVGFGSALLWSVAFGCAAAALVLAGAEMRAPALEQAAGETEVTIRGPLTYAGPGSLGGTESALRR